MNLKLLKVARFFHLIKKEKYKEKRQIEIVRHSPFFDEQWYLEQYPDVRASGMKAVEHYVKFGWKEGRNPGPNFDTNDYLKEYPELLEKNWCPLFHYMLEHKELMPKIEYKEQIFNLLDKYTNRYKGKSADYKLIAKSKYFNKRWYLKTYPDVKKAKIDPIEHYMKYGWKEGRNPGPKFSTQNYLDFNADVKRANINPLVHYERHGKKEGRLIGLNGSNKYTKRLKNYANQLSHNQKNILLITHSFSLTGAPLAVFNTAKYLKSKGYNVAIIGMDNRELVKAYQTEKIDCFSNISHINNDVIQSINKFDFIFANTVLVYQFIQHINQVPYLWRIAEGLDVKNIYANRPNLIETLAKDKNVYAVSKYTQRCLSTINNQTNLLLYGIDDISDQYEFKKNNDDSDKNKVRFCVIGTFCKRKAQDLIIKAVSMLSPKQQKSVEFHFIGNTKKDYIEQDNLFFHGILQGKEKYDILNSCDILLCPSLDDPNPQVVMEGMMMRKPCIVSDCTGQADYIKNKKNGFVVKAGSVESLKDCLLDILSGKYNLKQMGKKSYNLYKAYFKKEDYLKQVENIIEEKTRIVRKKSSKGDIFFSVIVASFNYQEYIKKTLDSMIEQTYKNFEVIIVDDGSTDNSLGIIKEYTKQYDFIKLYQHPNGANRGLPETIKLGLSHSNGEYIAFCESDDYWTPNHLEEINRIIKSGKNINFIVNDLFLFGDETLFKTKKEKIEFRKQELKKYKGKIPDCKFRENNYIMTFSGCCVNKQELLKCNILDVPKKTALDWWLWRQINFTNRIYFIDKKMTYWRLSKASYNNRICKEEALKHQQFVSQLDKIIEVQAKKKKIKSWFGVFSQESEEYKIISSSKLFNRKWYVKQYPEIFQMQCDPVTHYLTIGWKEGKNPSNHFDGNTYLELNLDVKRANVNPLLHYEKYGRKECRQISANSIKEIKFPKDALYISKTFESKKFFSQRVAVFASFFQNGKIPDYVIYYLKELRKITDCIVFIADCPVYKSELEKLDGLVYYAKFERHQEYDFGSYKRGYLYLKDNLLLNQATELIFCNDSCFGPMHSFSLVFDEMTQKICDFWGITENCIPINHLQSYFLVFKKNVFSHQVFDSFIHSITYQKNKKDIVEKYEYGLSTILQQNGFCYKSYIDTHEMLSLGDQYFTDLSLFYPFFLIRHKMPFLKCKCFFQPFRIRESTLNWILFMKIHTNYPINLILKNLRVKGIPLYKSAFYFRKKDVVKMSANQLKLLNDYRNLLVHSSSTKSSSLESSSPPPND